MEHLSTKEAAVILGYSTRTLYRWRQQGIGPKWTTYNGRVWYREDWLENWLDSVWAKSPPTYDKA